MEIATVTDFVTILRQFRLVESQALADDSLRSFSDARVLARELVQRGWLTPYQVNRIFLGKAAELVLGPYVLLERLGEGGMGAVYKARHGKLERTVAIKIIRKERLDNANAVRRFRREIRAVAQLDHPHIVRAIDADEVDGANLLVMEFVEGGTDLSQLVKSNGPLSIALACSYIRQAALGLQHASERGLVHRDIKPANLLLDPAGTVKILDLGLARMSPEAGEQSASTLTKEGTVMGSLDYMAPEQALDSHAVDIRADLYSLGCTFYFLLAGKAPFPGGDALAKLLKHRLEKPRPVEQLRPEASGVVAGVVHKLMAKRPEQRFQTPAELVTALDAVLAPTATGAGLKKNGAAPQSPFTDLWSGSTEVTQREQPGSPRQLSRPGMLLAGGGVLTLLTILVVVLALRSGSGGAGTTNEELPDVVMKRPVTLQQSEKERKAAAAETERKRHNEADETLPTLATKASDARATFAAVVKDVLAFQAKYGGTPAAARASELLMKLSSPLDQLDPAKIPVDAQASWKANGFDGKDVVAVLGEHKRRQWSSATSVAFHPSGKVVSSAGKDPVIHLWERHTGNELATLKGHSDIIAASAFSRDGRHLASGSHDGLVKVWDPETGKELATFQGPGGSIRCVALSPDGVMVAGGSQSGIVRLWSLTTKKELASLKGHKEVVYGLAFRPDGKVLAAGHGEYRKSGEVTLWDVASHERLAVISAHPAEVFSVAFSPDGNSLASGSVNDGVKIWDSATLKEKATFQGTIGRYYKIYSMAFSPDGRHLACAGNTARIWDLENGKERIIPASLPISMAMDRDGQVLAIGNDHGVISFWDPRSGKELQPLTGHVGAATKLAFSSDCSWLLSGAMDATLRLWELPSGKEVRRMDEGRGRYVFTLALGLDDQTALSGGNHGVFRLWDLRTGEELRAFDGHPLGITALATSPDRRRVLSSSQDGTLRLWDIQTGKSLREFRGHDGHVRAAALSADGLFALSGGNDRTVRLWDLADAKELRRLEGTTGHVFCAAFSLDSRYAVAGDGHDVVYMWDLKGASPEPAKLLKGHTKAVSGVAFAPNGRTVISCGLDGRVLLWSVPEGAKLREWKLPGQVSDVTFAADGRHVATANGNGTVYLLRLANF